MAPALPLAPRDPPDQSPEALDQSHRRQVLASVDNLSEDDVMGLQSHPNTMKDPSPLGDQMLVDLASNDLLSVIRQTLETNNDPLSAGDTDMFPLDLPETVDSESDPPEQRVLMNQARLERRSAFLLRRLRILQARALGKRASEEVAQTFEKATRGARKDGGGRPMGLKALLKRVETTATLQASAASRNVVGPRYYNAGTSRGDASKSASMGISSGTLTGLQDTAGALKAHLSVIKRELDSDATESSSGAESNDEAVVYNNPHQQPMPIEKRALWTWQRQRSTIMSCLCWLNAQVQELDYKIRQHADLHKSVREAKGPIEFEGEPVGYEGSLPGSDEDDDRPVFHTSARIRPLRRETFKKRRLLQMHNLHVSGNKASRPSDIRCSCLYPLESCSVCTGRVEPTSPPAPHTTLPPAQRLALIDPGYHPVLSDIKDVAPSVHMSALCSRGWFRARAPRGRGRRSPTSPRAPPEPRDYPLPKAIKKHPKMKRGRPPLSRKIREREREEEAAANHGGRGRTSTDSRSWRRQSYDIDNIVIPQSVAANNRPQILEYKEIITPKWRLNELPDAPLVNGVSKTHHRMSFDKSDDTTLFAKFQEEDVTETSIHTRHVRAETRERSRYARKQRVRRVNHDSPEEPPPPPSEPAPACVPQPQPLSQPQPMETETIPPYSPRRFPLLEEAYMEMLSAMPDGYRPSSPDPLPPVEEMMEDDSSTLSPVSPSAYEGDDPDDLEWEPSVEKSERKKSTFR